MTTTPATNRRILPSLALALAAAVSTLACGGASSVKPVTVAELKAAAPTSSAVDLDVAGTSPMTTATPLLSVSPTPDAMTMPPVTDVCHPHLFSRTGEVVGRLNAIFFRHLRHIEALIRNDPSLVAGTSATWTETGSSLEPQRQFTIERSADGLTYTFELDLAPSGQTPPVWTKVFGGTLTKTPTTTGRDQTADMTFDYDALHGVVPAEPLTGKVVVAWERLVDSSKPGLGIKKTSTVTFAAFSFGPLDPHGPRSGTYTHVGEPGVGGSLSFQDSVVLLCPSNPTSLVADTVTQSRWFLAADGAHGRADAKATGGQIPAGDTWMGVSCFGGPVDVMTMAATELGFYWAMKVEDSTGATLGSARSLGTATACDPKFGAVPSLTDNTTDYAFPSGPVGFPNEW